MNKKNTAPTGNGINTQNKDKNIFFSYYLKDLNQIIRISDLLPGQIICTHWGTCISQKQTQPKVLKQLWIYFQEVILSFNISKRTLQSLRDSGTLPYSRINGKFYYKIADLEKLLESNYSRNLKNESHD